MWDEGLAEPAQSSDPSVLGLLAYISVAGAWFWARSLHPAIVTWSTRITTGTRWRRKPVDRGGVHPGWRHATQPQERGCQQGWGCCPAPGGNDWPPTFGSSRGTKAAKGDAELLTPALGPSKDDTCHCTAGRLAGAHAGKCRLPPPGMSTGWGLPVPLRGSEVCARGARYAHAGGDRENMQGVGEEELSAQDCAPGPGPRYSDLCDVKKCQQGGRTTHHLQMTTPSCEKLTRADREPRGEHRMPPT